MQTGQVPGGMMSRMMREYHVRFCEGLRGRFPRATRRLCLIAQASHRSNFQNKGGGGTCE